MDIGEDMRVKVTTLLITSLLALALSAPLAVAQVPPEEFSVSPGEFTIRDAPTLGEPYRLERKLVIRNGDKIKRIYILSIKVPPENELREGYEAIPSENWIILAPAVIEVENGSWGAVDIYLNIPAWENLTNRRWEAWISVARQPVLELGETVAVEIISRAKIETAGELPPPPERLPLPPAMIALIVGIAAAAVALFIWIRHRRGKGEVRGRVFH
jgi:hypothetical protein